MPFFIKGDLYIGEFLSPKYYRNGTIIKFLKEYFPSSILQI